MRRTFGQLVKTAQNYSTDDETSATSNLDDTRSFLKVEINNAVATIFNLLRNYRTQRTQTISTVNAQQFYHLPPDFESVESATLEVGGVKYPLQIVASYDEWDLLNQLDFSGSAIPQFIFTRRDDFGIWPVPTAANTLTLNYNYMHVEMRADDYTTGTVATTQNSTALTGTDTVWTSAMVNRWFIASTVSGTTPDAISDWYRLASFSSTTSMALETSYETASLSGASYIIGESPEVPPELHMFIPHYAAGQFFAGPRRDTRLAQEHTNFFWTGDFYNNSRQPSRVKSGLLGAISRYGATGRANTRLVRKNRRLSSIFDERWRSTLSTT